MKNRIIKSGIIIAVVTLVTFNIQLLFDTTDSPILQGSTVSAVEDPTKPNTGYLRYHYLDETWCIIANVDIEFGVVTKWWGLAFDINIDADVDLNGSKMKCREITQEIYCQVSGATPCQSSDID